MAEEAETCERRDEEEDVVFSDGLELAPGVVWEAVMALGVTLARTDALYVVLGEWLGVLDICEVTLGRGLCGSVIVPLSTMLA